MPIPTTLRLRAAFAGLQTGNWLANNRLQRLHLGVCTILGNHFIHRYQEAGQARRQQREDSRSLNAKLESSLKDNRLKPGNRKGDERQKLLSVREGGILSMKEGRNLNARRRRSINSSIRFGALSKRGFLVRPVPMTQSFLGHWLSYEHSN